MKYFRVMGAIAVLQCAPTISLAASSPFGIATPDSPAGNGVTGPAAPLLLAAIRLQTQFYQKLTSALDAFANDPHAGLWLIGVSFLYGIFHAVGPGHGKAVISSYILATGERLRQAVAMSVIASLLQAVSAIAIILVAAGILDATAVEITSVTDGLELGSYALMTMLGLTLVTSKGRLFAHRWREERRPSSSFSCQAADAAVTFPVSRPGGIDARYHAADCGCFTASRLVLSKPTISMRERLQAILTIGIRPCSGALIVLVFALARHIALAGVMSVFAMAAGTAITVTFVALLSVLARGFLARLAVSNLGVKPRVTAGVEFAAACFVFLFAVTMLTGLVSVNGFF